MPAHRTTCRPAANRRRRHGRAAAGATLVEMLTVVGISAVVMGIGAAHFATIRQVDDLITERRVAQQRARVAMERISRYIRNATEVVAITPAADTEGSITVRDNHGVDHVLERTPGATYLRFRVVGGTNYQLASEIDSLYYIGYDTSGPVPETEPGRIRIVQIKMVAKVVGSTDTIAITSQAQLRKRTVEVGAAETLSYATASVTTGDDPIGSRANGYGPPDSLGAYLQGEQGQKFQGFALGTHTGTVQSMFVGFRTYYKDHDFGLRVRHGTTVLVDDFLTKEEHLRATTDIWVWHWQDITNTRASWTDEDIDDLSIEVRDTGSNAKCYFDCFAVRAFFQPVQTTFVWASQEGSWAASNDWPNGANAIAAPDGLYAQGIWDPELRQSYRGASVPANDDEILTAHVCINGYVSSAFADDYLKVWIERSTGEKEEYRLYAAGFAPFVGSGNQGNILRHVNHVAWTWSEFSNYEIWFEPKRSGSADSSLFADAVGWRIVHVPASNQRTLEWSE